MKTIITIIIQVPVEISTLSMLLELNLQVTCDL